MPLFPAGKVKLDTPLGVIAENKGFVRHDGKARKYPG
jgi:hypothetical protein